MHNFKKIVLVLPVECKNEISTVFTGPALLNEILNGCFYNSHIFCILIVLVKSWKISKEGIIGLIDRYPVA